MGMIEALGEYLDLLPEPVGRMVGLAFDGADSDTVFGTLQPYMDEVGFYVSDEIRGWQAAVAESLGEEQRYMHTKDAATIEENHAAMREIQQLCPQLKDRCKQVIDIAGSGLGMKSRLPIHWTPSGRTTA